VGCYIWYSEEGPGRAAAPPSRLLALPNVTAHSSMASVPTSYYSMCHYNYLCTVKGQLITELRIYTNLIMSLLNIFYGVFLICYNMNIY